MSFTISKRQSLVVSDCFIQTAGLTEGREGKACRLPISHPSPTQPTLNSYVLRMRQNILSK